MKLSKQNLVNTFVKKIHPIMLTSVPENNKQKWFDLSANYLN